jgi:DNA-binding beta-propeller fold protein YncE
MGTLLEALEAALKGSAVTLLRVTPTIMRQLNALCEEVALQEQDLKQLALAVYSPAVRGMPARQRALVTQLENLLNAPAADVMGKLVGTLGPHGSGSGECERPLGVAVSGGLLYVADCDNSRVQVFNTETREFVCVIGQSGKGSGELRDPRGVAVSGGLLYVTDYGDYDDYGDRGNSRVQVFNTEWLAQGRHHPRA